ncbi:MAG: extracellular solute-binding protein [Lachnospiraceae bacterium]|nr:extracellular solute-binding protein [Lachnospiraceae bacterium]
MKMNQNKRNKLTAVILILTMLATVLAGCKKTGDNEEKKDGTVYIPEYIELDFGMSNESVNVSDAVAIQDVLYLDVSSWSEEGGRENGLYKYNPADGKMERFPLDLGENDYLSRMTPMPDGNLAMLIERNTYEMDENGEITDYSSELELRMVSTADGSIIDSRDVTQLIGGDNPYIQQFAIDGKGNYYFYTGDDKLYLADANLTKVDDISINGWINSLIVSKEGDAYISAYGDSGIELKKIDPESKTLGEKIGGLKEAYGSQNFYKGTSKSILISSENVSLFDIETATEEKLFGWIDVDVNSNYIDKIGELSDGRIWAVYQDYEAESSKSELLIVQKADASQAVQKEEITFGTVGIDYDVKRLIINFNKSNEKYRIVVKDYSTEDWETGVTQFQADLTTANCPDLIDVRRLNYSMYANKGILEDLYPYMEKSGLKKEDFVESVLRAYEIDGKLYAMIPEFYVSTVMAKKSVVGDIDGWTLTEMLDFAEANNPEYLFSYGSRYSIFYSCIYNNIDEFVDWETGKCNFDGEEFIRTLEFAAKYPDPEEEMYIEQEEGTYARLKANKILLMDSSVSSVQQFQMYQGMFGEEIAFVGYPNHERRGNLIMPSGTCIGISSKSKNKDGAWEFIQSMLSEENQKAADWGFPVLKSALEQQFEEDMTPEYYEDENGEKVETTKTSWGYDDFDIDIYAAKQEEVDAVRRLIDSADKLYSSADGQLNTIISEEADPFFKGQKSAADVAKIIQNRIQTYVNENR